MGASFVVVVLVLVVVVVVVADFDFHAHLLCLVRNFSGHVELPSCFQKSSTRF